MYKIKENKRREFIESVYHLNNLITDYMSIYYKYNIYSLSDVNYNKILDFVKLNVIIRRQVNFFNEEYYNLIITGNNKQVVLLNEIVSNEWFKNNKKYFERSYENEI